MPLLQLQVIKIVEEDAKARSEAFLEADDELMIEEPGDEWTSWLLLKFGEDNVSMEHLDAIPAAVLWMLRAFVEHIDKVDEDDDMPVGREHPVDLAQDRVRAVRIVEHVRQHDTVDRVVL